MNVYNMTQESIPAVAELMCTMKPEWWDYEGAFSQLSDINESIKTIGWYLGEDSGHPAGWILCRELVGLRAIELECSGFNDNGVFKLEHKLGRLLDTAAGYARGKGYLTFRNGISSAGFNIHGKKIENIADAIRDLECDRFDYKWMLDYGFRVIGIQPNAYEEGFHLIMMAKEI
ncbi:MAG: hypothetical protein KH900_03750 [[Clostridium] symbiosum]|nr:hypothetical protein [[Clostridium] symbiosum]